MPLKREIAVSTIIVSFENGLRIERKWNDIPEDEQKVISRNITDRFMEAMGYIGENKFTGQLGQPAGECVPAYEENGVIFSAQEAADYLNVSYITILRMAHKNALPYFQAGRKLLFRKDRLDAWILDQERQ